MIDTHVHVWTLEPAVYPWQPTLPDVPIPGYPATVEQLTELMSAGNVDRAVLVQPSTYGWDNSYLCDALARFPGQFQGVCLVDPFSPRAADDLAHWVTIGQCRGLRINSIGHPGDAAWLNDRERTALWDAAFELGVRVCFQMHPRQTESVVTLARRLRGITFLVDCLGSNAYFDPTALAAVESLAREPNIHFKIVSAGQDSRVPFPFKDFWPLMRHVIEQFGIERLTLGTDFPHVLQKCEYGQAARWIEELPFVGEAERKAMGETNARALWGFA